MKTMSSRDKEIEYFLHVMTHCPKNRVKAVFKPHKKEKTGEIMYRVVFITSDEPLGHRWVDRRYIPSLKAWFDRCELCGLRRVMRTTMDGILIDDEGRVRAKVGEVEGFLREWYIQD